MKQHQQTEGEIRIVGLGPGDPDFMTFRGIEAIRQSQVVIGYRGYVEQVRHLLSDQQVIAKSLTEEVDRAQTAFRMAREGKRVAVVSSGDAGVYGMAGLVFEVMSEQGWREEDGPEVTVVPGIAAAHACASLVGAPLMHDSCSISLSDLLTPWDVIRKRVEAAAGGDFVTALYNPRSQRRKWQIEEVRRMFLRYRSPQTPVVLVKNAYRPGQTILRTTLEEMPDREIDMLTTVLIGNSRTEFFQGWMVTPRGYRDRYDLGAEEVANPEMKRTGPGGSVPE
ncbi:precorrin-3B C(17)-methyltransferase [Paludifilum halophilum]|uniref:Precorrin-3B C(17)-methyltransferase n=1 Tax=Paludifilum halophilum TaxID=1642702 RepID=A0A235B936_9BACL|nr:precorrin-3B C(17)-methyltransferase [Paludifilum halophilum]OYD08804.1 precorrin-3B C(17)-methyltransferase [Paludifilum halophilum]